jgi:hypothetical protein
MSETYDRFASRASQREAQKKFHAKSVSQKKPLSLLPHRYTEKFSLSSCTVSSVMLGTLRGLMAGGQNRGIDADGMGDVHKRGLEGLILRRIVWMRGRRGRGRSAHDSIEIAEVESLNRRGFAVSGFLRGHG